MAADLFHSFIIVRTLERRVHFDGYIEVDGAYYSVVTASLAIGESVVAHGGLVAGIMIATSVAPTTTNALNWPTDR